MEDNDPDMNNKVPLSVAIITKNEQVRLPDCLRSVSFVDDIVIVDSESTDDTVNIAKQFGCRVFVEDWKGDGPQKNSAIAKTKNEWVLVLDADERLTCEAKEEIMAIISSETNADAYSFPRKSIFHGKWIKHGGWWPDRVVRLFKKSKGRYHSITHGQWITTGKQGLAKGSLEHYSFVDYSDMIKRLNNYSSFRANEMFNEKAASSYFKAASHGLFMFFNSFVLKRGFLEGLDGLVIALTTAGVSFFKYAKLVENHKYNK